MQRENIDDKNIDDKDLLNKVHETISGLDEQRLQELNNLKQHQEIKNEVLQLESKRLANKHGEDHPRVQKTMARLAANREVFVALDKEAEKAAIKTELLPANSWRVHGKVFDEKNSPVSGVTVFLSDVQKNAIRDLGSICTDDTGYYVLTIEEKLMGVIEQKPLYLAVSSKSPKILYQRPEPVIAIKGFIEYADIYLNEKDCAPPEGGEGKPKKEGPSGQKKG